MEEQQAFFRASGNPSRRCSFNPADKTANIARLFWKRDWRLMPTQQFPLAAGGEAQDALSCDEPPVGITGFASPRWLSFAVKRPKQKPFSRRPAPCSAKSTPSLAFEVSRSSGKILRARRLGSARVGSLWRGDPTSSLRIEDF
jgi:hypothetical protein